MKVSNSISIPEFKEIKATNLKEASTVDVILTRLNQTNSSGGAGKFNEYFDNVTGIIIYYYM